jgi:CheY-like chemotaxis protein
MPVSALNIMLVEDELADMHLIRFALNNGELPVSLHHACDGLDAVQYLEQHPATLPDLILLDLNMPRMDGKEFLKTVKHHPMWSQIPVVVLTTSDAERDVLDVYRLGAAGYVTKPSDMTVFVDAMHHLKHYWMQTVRLPGRLLSA